jgi:DNA-binding MurR/RpiR family transcriptional regulator
LKQQTLFDYRIARRIANVKQWFYNRMQMPENTVNVAALYAALDQKRGNSALSWRSLAAKLQVPPSTFTRMAQGLKPDVDAFATMLQWLGMSQEQFLEPTADKQESDPMSMISSYLRSAKNIRHEDAAALEDIISTAYRHIVGGRK